MLIQTRIITVQKGFSDKVVERFSAEGPMDTMEGFIDRSVMINRKRQDHEEVMVLIRWESLEAWKNWEKSDAHIQGHKNGKSKPEYVLSVAVNMYELKAVKKGRSND